MSARKQICRKSSRSFSLYDENGNSHIFFMETYVSFDVPSKPAFRAAAKRFVKSGLAVAKGYDISRQNGEWVFEVCIK
jgi:hypothetical protein